MADVLLLLNTNNGRCDVEGNPRHVCYISLWHKINYFRGNHRVREKFSYPLVPRTSTLLNLVVKNPRVLVQNVLSCS